MWIKGINLNPFNQSLGGLTGACVKTSEKMCEPVREGEGVHGG